MTLRLSDFIVKEEFHAWPHVGIDDQLFTWAHLDVGEGERVIVE
jgi:hypothetical protein